jgi:hypothetical protein
MYFREADKEPWERSKLSTKLELAEEFLLLILADGAVPVKEIYKEGATAWGVGLPERTIDRAKAVLGIVSKKDGKVWFWELPSSESVE